MAYRDIEKRRRTDLARFHRRNEGRRAAGLCLKCGKTEPAPERTLCEPCREKRRAADRARTARLRAEGKPRRDPERAKRYERERSRRQHAERKAAGICTKCGRAPARPERTTCEPCAEKHRARDRARHARAKAEGIADPVPEPVEHRPVARDPVAGQRLRRQPEKPGRLLRVQKVGVLRHSRLLVFDGPRPCPGRRGRMCGHRSEKTGLRAWSNCDSRIGHPGEDSRGQERTGR